MQVSKYYGSDKPREEYLRLAITKVPRELRDNEAELQAKRWFDYRLMTPAQATYLFAGEYRHAYIEAFKRTRDIRRADEIRPFAPEDIFDCKELIALWQARQAADGIGCKYDFYLRFAFRRYEHRGWRFLPRPNHLATEELILDVKDAWDVECRASLQVAEMSLYRADAFDDMPEQREYYDWLCGQVKLREHPYLALSRLVYTDPILPEPIALQHFNESTLKRAKNFAEK